MTDPHDQRALDLLRLDLIHYQRLYRDLYHAACAQLAEMQVLERKLDAAYAELRRYTSERCA